MDRGGSSWCSVWCGFFIVLRNSWSSHFSSSSSNSGRSVYGKTSRPTLSTKYWKHKVTIRGKIWSIISNCIRAHRRLHRLTEIWVEAGCWSWHAWHRVFNWALTPRRNAMQPVVQDVTEQIPSPVVRARSSKQHLAALTLHVLRVLYRLIWFNCRWKESRRLKLQDHGMRLMLQASVVIREPDHWPY